MRIASAAVQASENKTPDVINRIMAEPVHNLSLMDADPQGALRWVVWQEGQADSRVSYLALYQQAKGSASPVWSTSWPDAWAPALQPLTEWRWQGNALLWCKFPSLVHQAGDWALSLALRQRVVLADALLYRRVCFPSGNRSHRRWRRVQNRG